LLLPKADDGKSMYIVSALIEAPDGARPPRCAPGDFWRHLADGNGGVIRTAEKDSVLHELTTRPTTSTSATPRRIRSLRISPASFVAEGKAGQRKPP
jgi:hypothetical protein